MPWLFLLLAIAALAIAFMTASMAVVVVSLLAALVLLGLWILGLLAQRIDTRSRDDVQMLDPRELQRLRELAEARRAEPAPAMEDPRTP
ncbi:hypothetical protein [Luteimonas kalidii]|jgi:hypothetical protein|uniref:Uncharacterized protein n=1 Tax=Luteimonas kalidii TaxID=3042025 RepID=A0ABT6JNR7_9GAMM|nr:hypothetical protein [Luteimonas kalidii]MDH5832330.1 hypothetical protein [Luteimonas kalidii]